MGDKLEVGYILLGCFFIQVLGICLMFTVLVILNRIKKFKMHSTFKFKDWLSSDFDINIEASSKDVHNSETKSRDNSEKMNNSNKPTNNDKKD